VVGVTALMPGIPSAGAIQISGGGGAPGRARSHVLAQLEGRIAPAAAFDAALLVSELVTNSVLHADVDHQQALTVELATLDDRIRLSVTDAGSSLEPRMLPEDRTTPGGFGLRLVNDMSCAWGVERDAAGRTRVWCELALSPVALL
jgi:anti-sigma regulatory factor (Ser/Thr protein kinase)